MNNNDFYCNSVLNNAIEVQRELETETVLAFRHTKPAWTFHIVIIPKIHIPTLIEIKDLSIFSEIFTVIQKLISKYGLNEKNYKIISNGGGFQDSKHVHFHLVSGEQLVK